MATPSSSFSSFWPNWYVDITDQWERKLKALNVYQQEMRPWPHSRSCEAVEHLARLRGSQIGRHYAEAFTLQGMLPSNNECGISL